MTGCLGQVLQSHLLHQSLCEEQTLHGDKPISMLRSADLRNWNFLKCADRAMANGAGPGGNVYRVITLLGAVNRPDWGLTCVTSPGLCVVQRAFWLHVFPLASVLLYMTETMAG